MNRGFVKSHGKPAFRGAPFAGRRPVKAPTAAAPADPDAPQRLSKRMSELGLSSRREADAWIAAGWVKVNGVTAELGQKVTREDVITIDRRASAEQGERVTILINKPVGYVSGQAEDGYEPAKVLVTPENHWAKDTSSRRWSRAQLAHLVPAGRLDIDSMGLLVLTQDGRVAKTIIGETSDVDKEYIVRVGNADGTVPLRLSDKNLPRQSSRWRQIRQRHSRRKNSRRPGSSYFAIRSFSYIATRRPCSGKATSEHSASG